MVEFKSVPVLKQYLGSNGAINFANKYKDLTDARNLAQSAVCTIQKQFKSDLIEMRATYNLINSNVLRSESNYYNLSPKETLDKMTEAVSNIENLCKPLSSTMQMFGDQHRDILAITQLTNNSSLLVNEDKVELINILNTGLVSINKQMLDICGSFPLKNPSIYGNPGLAVSRENGAELISLLQRLIIAKTQLLNLSSFISSPANYSSRYRYTGISPTMSIINLPDTILEHSKYDEYVRIGAYPPFNYSKLNASMLNTTSADMYRESLKTKLACSYDPVQTMVDMLIQFHQEVKTLKYESLRRSFGSDAFTKFQSPTLNDSEIDNLLTNKQAFRQYADRMVLQALVLADYILSQDLSTQEKVLMNKKLNQYATTILRSADFGSLNVIPTPDLALAIITDSGVVGDNKSSQTNNLVCALVSSVVRELYIGDQISINRWIVHPKSHI